MEGAREVKSINVSSEESLKKAIVFFCLQNDDAESVVDVKLRLIQGGGHQFLNALKNSIRVSSKAKIISFKIYGPFDSAGVSTSTLSHLCETLGTENLEQFSWQASPVQSCLLSYLTAIISGSPNLKTLQCNGSFQATPDTLRGFAHALRGHSSLEVVEVPHIVPPPDWRIVGASDFLQYLSNHYLGSLSTTQTLATLDLRGLVQNFITFASRPNLKQLALRAIHVEQAFPILTNLQNLKILTIWFLDLRNENACRRVGELLRTNEVLQSLTLELSFKSSSDDEGNMRHVTDAMKQNSTLTSLAIFYGFFPQFFSNEMQTEFVTMLEKNLTIHYFEIVLGGHRRTLMEIKEYNELETLQDMRFYTKMNRLGRKSLIVGANNVSRKEWVEKLILAKDDSVKATFYILSLNPSLCVTTTN